MTDVISKSVQTWFNRHTLPDHLVKIITFGLFEIPFSPYLPAHVFSHLTENSVLNVVSELEQDYIEKWTMVLGLFGERLVK